MQCVRGFATAFVLWVIVTSLPCAAQHAHQRLPNGPGSLFTSWDIDHEKEDGTGNDICIMEAHFPSTPAVFAIRKDITRSYYKQRMVDPGVSFAYAELQEVNTVFDGDLVNKSWHGSGSGTGPVFDMRIPGGVLFDQYLSQLLEAQSVGVVVGEHVWETPIFETRRAFAVLQDCIASVTVHDGRW